MNDILDIEIILTKQKYHAIYNVGLIIIIILLTFIYVSYTYKYKTYYITKGTMIDGDIEVLVKIDDIKYINNNNFLTIDDALYKYTVKEISKEIYVDESFNNYKYIYLKVDNLNNINNYVHEIKLEKEYKEIIQYLKDYL